MAKKVKVPITMRALVQRINRALPRSKRLKIARDDKRELLGNYYIVDANFGAVVQMHVDVEALARELGCLERWEKVDA